MFYTDIFTFSAQHSKHNIAIVMTCAQSKPNTRYRVEPNILQNASSVYLWGHQLGNPSVKQIYLCNQTIGYHGQN